MAQYTFDTLLDFDIAKIVIPSGYTKLNYIENTGNSYILLNYKANNNTIVQATLSYNSTTGDQAPYGCDNWWAYRSSGYIVFLSPSLSVDFGNRRVNLGQGINIDSWYTLQQSQDGFFVNGTKLAFFNQQTFTCINNFAIFTFGAGVSGNSFLNGKIKAISVKDLPENFELIACQNSDNEIGMYDVVNNVFYGNNGTGTFTSGGTAPIYNFQNGDTCTITELNLTMTYNDGYFWIADNQSLTLSQANQLFSFAKGNNGVTATITDLGITLTSDGTDWYVTSDITIPTVSQANQLFSFAKGNNGVTVTVTSTEGVYKYDGYEWQLWYTIIPPLVFRGCSFEIMDKVGGASMFHGMV